MSYSCVDFTADILNALNLNIPEEHWYNPSGQAGLALAKIEAMQLALQAAEATLSLCAGKVPDYVEVRRTESLAMVRALLTSR